MALFMSSDLRDGGAGDDFFDPDATYGADAVRDPDAGPNATPTAPRATTAKRPSAARAGTGTGVFRGGALSDESDDDDDGTSDVETADVTNARTPETLDDATAYVRQLLQQQIQRATETRAPPNAAVAGDGVARGIMLLLLPETMLRTVFLEVAKTPAAWPRIRSLFGAPPYHFLRPEDGGTLRAAGFARGRENIAYDEANRIANVAQFVAQFDDSFEREYRLVARSASGRDSVPCARRVSEQVDDTFAMQVKIRKRSLKMKRKLAHGDTKRKLFFPRPGERLELRESRALQRVLRLRAPQTIGVRVVGVRPRGMRAHTAELLVRRE